MKRYRFAMLGLGRVADVHYASLQAFQDRAELAAVCDSRPEAVGQRSREWHVPGFTDFEKLLAQTEVDAVCMLLPHHLHPKFVKIAAQHGKHILLEKPLALSREHAQEIVDDVKKYGITLLVGHNGLFHPAFEQMVDFVRNGSIGRPLFARGTSCGWLTFRPWDFRMKKSEAGGGCWIDAGGHLIYSLREILGDVDSITGMTANLARPEMEGEDHAIAMLRYKSGALAQLYVSYGHKLPGYQHDWPLGYLHSIEVYGDKGAIQYVTTPEPRLSYFSEVPEVMPEKWQGWLSHQPPEPFGISFEKQFKHFLDCLDTGKPPRTTATDALETVKVLLALYDREAELQRMPPR